MGRIIAIANQKGGVGKTTTAINLSACLAEAGKRVLTVDLDPQGNTTSGLGVSKNEQEKTTYELLIGQSSVEECLLKEVLPGLDILPSNVELSGAEIELIGIEGKEFIALLPLEGEEVYLYEYKEEQEDIVLDVIEEDDVFERVSNAFYSLYEEE